MNKKKRRVKIWSSLSGGHDVFLKIFLRDSFYTLTVIVRVSLTEFFNSAEKRWSQCFSLGLNSCWMHNGSVCTEWNIWQGQKPNAKDQLRPGPAVVVLWHRRATTHPGIQILPLFFCHPTRPLIKNKINPLFWYLCKKYFILDKPKNKINCIQISYIKIRWMWRLTGLGESIFHRIQVWSPLLGGLVYSLWRNLVTQTFYPRNLFEMTQCCQKTFLRPAQS